MTQASVANPTRTVDGREIPAPGTYVLDASHSSVEFKARHLMISKVRGGFTRFVGQIVVAEDPADSEVEVTIDASSLTTGDEQRDAHLRSADFFEVLQHPSITFRSTSVKPEGKGWTVTGDLTIKGVTHPVTLAARFEGAGPDPWGNQRLGVSASGQVDREAWGLTWNQALEAGGVLVSRNVNLEITAQAIRQD